MAKRQTEFKFKTWGGKREGAGRKPSGAQPGASHLRRPELPPRCPIHVTLRMLPHVWNLRSRRSFRFIGTAIYMAAQRYAMRVCEYSIQGNHAHMVVEAPDRGALAQGMQGVGIRIAKGLNKLMDRRGRVLADRYHAHILKTPTEVRNAVHYVIHSYRRHALQRGERLPPSFVDPYSSLSREIPLPDPHTWPLRILGSHAPPVVAAGTGPGIEQGNGPCRRV